MTEPPLLGRERELGVLHDLISSVGVRGGALVLRGDPGVGKSSLLLAVRRAASDRGLPTLAATGFQSETRLAFAGLHQLLRPILADVAALPPSQRAALDAAFGRTVAAAPDPFVIALAALDLLSEAAARSPLVLVVEDAHWLDRPTCDVLAFVARRVEAEPLVLTIAIRDGYENPLLNSGLPELPVEGLHGEDARALLEARFPALVRPLRERVLAEARGNPLALIELPTALTSNRRADGLPTARLALTARLERTFAERWAELPDPTRWLLLVASLDDGGVLDEVTTVTGRVAGGTTSAEDLAAAVNARLVETDGFELRFRHPLVRSAIRDAATAEERRAAHAALADVLADQPDRQVWHRAASVRGPDEGIARDLTATAARAQQRGAMVVAISALERAGGLSEPRSGARRFLRAAELAFEIGRQDLVRRLLDRVGGSDLDPHERARAALVRESPSDGAPGDPVRVRALVEIAVEIERAGDTDLALSLLLGAALRCWWADPGVNSRDLVIAAAQSADVHAADPRLLAILSMAGPFRCAEVVLERLESTPAGSIQEATAARLLGFAGHAAGDCALSSSFLAQAIPGLRAQGRLALLAQVLTVQAWNAIHLGDWKAAGAFAEEGNRLAQETAQPIWTSGSQIAMALLLGVQGDRERAEFLADDAERAVLPAGLGDLLCVLEFARGLTDLTSGHYADAHEHLRRMFEPGDPAHHFRARQWGIGYLAEAAVHCDRRDDARAIIGALRPVGAHRPSPGVRLAMRYADAVLAADEDAADLFSAALSDDCPPFFRARLQLAFGEFLRRRRRVAESRIPLRQAQETFDGLGIPAWSERARRELHASGGRARRGARASREQLTAQERQIAQLAAGGLSNREIGQQLYLSHRTVGSHLYRIFPKLGITSRAQLGAALAGGGRDQ